MAESTVSLLSERQGWLVAPPTSAQGLSDQEQKLIAGLSSKLTLQGPGIRIARSYYEGTQKLANLGVSIPQQLAGVRTVVDWPRIAVDPLVQRCVVDGFRLPGATDVDSELMEHWQANSMDAESPLCWLDSFVAGRGYMVVGPPDRPGGSPLITVESPMNLSAVWSPRTRKITSAYQVYEVEGDFQAVLYLPNETITLSRQDQGGDWSIVDRDQHNMGEVPVFRFPNRARSDNREGFSEISPAVMNTTDSAVRSLLAMEIAREFYAIPHRYILGATESDYVSADGTPKTALDMVMSKFLAFENDDQGNSPTVGQFAAFDPSVFTKIIDKHAQLMASYTQFPPDWFGQIAASNPASADAIRVAQDGVNRRSAQAQDQFSDPLEDAMRMVWRMAHDGAPVPDAYYRMETDWVPAAAPTPAATADALFKQAQMGAVSPTSDVVLSRLGYSALEREKLEIDRQVDLGASVLAELAQSLQAKEARVDTSIAHDIRPGGQVAASAASESGNGAAEPTK